MKQSFNVTIMVRRVLSFILLTYILVVLSSSQAVANDEYYEVAQSAYGVYFLYLPSIEDRGDYTVAWTKIMLKAPEMIDGIKPYNEMRLVAINKKFKQIQILACSFFAKDGRILFSDSRQFDELQWEECIPDTVTMTLWKEITTRNERGVAKK